MADEVASLLVRVTADGSQAVGVLNGITSTVAALTDKNASLMNKIGASGKLVGTIGKTITKTFGVATVAGLTASAKAAGQLNKGLANIGTLSVPTERLREFKGQIQDIAVETAKGTSDISAGTYQVVSAFGDAADTMDKVEINAKAAKAGLATTTDSINLTSAVTKAYGDTSAKAVQHVADLAFKTVELGQTTFPELAASMGQVTSQSKVLGVSQEELFTAFATLTGVTGNASEVSTQLKAVYTALEKPSENMQRVITELGYSSGYTMINTLGLAGTIEALTKATDGSDEALLSLFNNQRALPAILALTGAQADTFTEKLEKMKNASGAATKAFEVQTQGVAKTGFTLEQAKVKMEVAAQRFGESAAPVIGDFAGVVDKAATALSGLSEEQRKSIINTGLAVTKTGVAMAVGGKAVTMGVKLASTVKTVGTLLTATGTAAAPAALAITGVTAATVAGVKAYEAYKESQLDLLPDMDAGIQKLDSYKSNLDELTALQKEAADLRAKMQDSNVSDEDYASAVNRLNEIKQILSEKYHIDVDSTDIDTSIEKAKTLQRTMAASEAKELSNSIASDKSSYDKNKIRLSDFTTQKIDFNNLSQAAGQAKAALEALHEQYLGGAINEKAYHDGAVNLIKDFNEFSTENTRKEFSMLGDTFDTTTEHATDSYGSTIGKLINIENGASGMVRSLQGEIDKYSASIDEYEQKCKTYAENSLAWLAYDAQANDSKAAEQDLNNMASAIKNAGLNANYYAQQAAVAQSGQKSLNDIWSKGGEVLDKTVACYISVGQQFGLTTQQAQLGGALIKEGFSDIASAASIEGGLDAVLNKFKEMSGQTDITGESLTKLAHDIDVLPDNKQIEINAKGDVSVVDTVAEKIKNLEGKTFAVTMNTEGDTSGVDKVDNRISKLDGKKCVVTFTADGEPAIATIDGVDYRLENYNGTTGTATLLAENGDAIAVIDLTTGKIYNIPTEHNTNLTASDDVSKPAGNAAGAVQGIPTSWKSTWIAEDGITPAAKNAAAAIRNIPQKWQTTYTVTTLGTITGNPSAPGWAAPKAKGDMNFSGGLAMVNDERGIPDPRELIIDRGRAFIPQGKDVILPLSKGAKVYTAAQTRAIMTGLGIPRYAEGKNNSDAFTSASDSWSHYTRTHAVTVTEELEKWTELSKEFTDNIKDAEDIEEQIFSIAQKMRSELNEQSKAYIIDRAEMNDWQSWGDDAVSAFNRVRDRENRYAAEGKITAKEADEYIVSLGADMYDARVANSKAWLEHEAEYNNMSVEEYIAGLDRMAEYTNEYYANGLITAKAYYTGLQEIADAKTDKQREAADAEVRAWENSASGYKEQRDLYGDWDAWGDSAIKYYERCIERRKEFFAAGKIDWDTYNESVIGYQMDLYRAQSDAFDDMLSAQNAYIDSVDEMYSDLISQKETAFDMSAMKRDIDEEKATMALYAGAVTQRGKDVYKDASERLAELNHQKEIKELQMRQTEVVTKLRDEYAVAEKYKKTLLNGLNACCIDVEAITRDISSNAADMQGLFQSLIDAINKLNVGQSVVYGDTNYNINGQSHDVMSYFMPRALTALSGG